MSNVFNDIVELDSGEGNIMLLRGIEARSDIGFLSLFEHYNVCQVPRCTLEPSTRVPWTHEMEGHGGGETGFWFPDLAGVQVQPEQSNLEEA